MNDDDFTPRDIFAGLAMVGLITKIPLQVLDREEEAGEYNNIAFSAYEYADAMLEARKVDEYEGIASIHKRKEFR